MKASRAAVAGELLRGGLGTPSSQQHTASPSTTQERARRRASASTISGEAVGQVVPRPAVEPHAVAVLAGDDAEAVVLDLVDPRRA